MSEEPRFVGIKELAKMLDVAQVTVYRQVTRGVLPKPVYIATRVPRWRLDEVLEALEARRATSTEAYARGMSRHWRVDRRAVPAAAEP